jgi:predicted nucleic-acid-binding protein
MLAVDTNIVVRYVVGDGGEQFWRAVDILENNEVSITLTVVLETEWVLRDAYEFAREDVLATLEKVFGLPTVTLRDQGIVRKAMNLTASGMDFADALHLTQAGECEAFVTFDKPLVRKAKGLIDTPVKAA